jgi:hypothetical protein
VSNVIVRLPLGVRLQRQDGARCGRAPGCCFFRRPRRRRLSQGAADTGRRCRAVSRRIAGLSSA